MKIKLWVSPDGLEFLKDWKGCGKQFKAHSISAWRCFGEKKNNNKFCISFGRKENDDASFTLVCSEETVRELQAVIENALNKEHKKCSELF